MARDVVCGIYCIENKVNHKKYIGQSIDVYRRWSHHKCDLNRNDHKNIKLQNSWNKYGEQNFEFYLIEQCDKGLLDEREIYYIDKFDTYHIGYN